MSRKKGKTSVDKNSKERTVVEELLAQPDAVHYLTHDNGGRAFLVVHVGSSVHVFKRPDEVFEEEPRLYTVLVKHYSDVVRVLPGVPQPEYPEFVGNSVLLQLPNLRYAFAADALFEFDAPEEIERLYSYVGNSDVPYPVAVGKKNAFFMLDKVYLPKAQFNGFDDWLNGYEEFYNIRDTQPNFANVDEVHERVLG